MYGIMSLYTLTLQKRELLLICYLVAYWKSAEKTQYPNWVKHFKALSCPADLIFPEPTQAGMPLKPHSSDTLNTPCRTTLKGLLPKSCQLLRSPSGPSLQALHTDSPRIKRICHNKKKTKTDFARSRISPQCVGCVPWHRNTKLELWEGDQKLVYTSGTRSGVTMGHEIKMLGSSQKAIEIRRLY